MTLLLAATAGNSTTWLEPAITGIVVALTRHHPRLARPDQDGCPLFVTRNVVFRRTSRRMGRAGPEKSLRAATSAGERRAAAFVIAFVVISSGVEFAAGLLRWIASLVLLGWIDLVAGAALGLLLGCPLHGPGSGSPDVRRRQFQRGGAG